MNYNIVPLRHQDMYLIMQWRNDQMQILRQNTPLTLADQERYYHEVIEPSTLHENPHLKLFSILLNDTCIGYGGLTNIDWNERRAEVSFLLATERTKNQELYEKEFGLFLTFLKNLAFRELKLKELFTETYNTRPHHINVLENHGFVFQKEEKGRARKGETMLDSVFHTCRSENG